MTDIRDMLFSARSYMPIPFILGALIFADPTPGSMVVGAVIAIAGELMRFWGVAYAGSLTRVTGSVGAPEVIMAGPFSRVRNPLYIGNILLYTGVSVMSMALWPWLAIGTFVFFTTQYVLIVSREEEFLAKEFGEQYAEYSRNVPRFLPRFTTYRNPVQEDQRADWKAGARSERRTFQAIMTVCLLLIIVWMIRIYG